MADSGYNSSGIPIPPHVVRATVVVTMSDGSRCSWVVEGDEGTYLTITTEPKWTERWSAAQSMPIRESMHRDDLTFQITDATWHGQTFYEPSAGDGGEQGEIEKAPTSIEQT